MQTTQTIEQFIELYGITAGVEPAVDNPNMVDDGTPMNHYRVTLRHGPATMVVPYSMGIGLTREPTAEDVLDSLASDAAGVENARGFEAWCAEYGFDTDSRRAYRTWEAIGEQAGELRALLGDVEYEVLLWDTERL